MSRFDQPEQLNDEQRRLLKLVKMDAEQLESRVNCIADGRQRAIAITELEKTVTFIRNAIANGIMP